MDSLLIFVGAVLAVPGATSILAKAIRTISDTSGVPPKLIVYVASLIITGIGVAFIAPNFPAWGGDPVAYTGVWLAWLTANAEIARRLYELVTERVTTD